jgi:hypothetical protein
MTLFWQMHWMTCLFYCHINYFTFSHHFASNVSFGIIKHLLTRYSGNSKYIKLLTFHLRTPICIKHTPIWQKNINKYKKCMQSYLLHIIDISLTHLKTTAIEIQGIKIIKKEWNQEKRTFSIIKQITHSWEGGRADC